MAEKRIVTTEAELQALVKAMVQQTLVEMLGLNAQSITTPKEPEWTEPRQAAKLLGCPVSELHAKRKNGWFKLDYHYTVTNNDPGASSNGVRYKYHVERCRDRLSESPAKWMNPKRRNG